MTNVLSVAFVEENSCPEPNTGCWLVKPNEKNGYASWRFNYKKIKAHRASWIAHNGPIPDWLFVCHKCDTPPCVNPDHLFLGTIQDNNADRDAKRRHAYGERNGRAVISSDDAKRIRELLKSGIKQIDVAAMYGIGQAQVSRIKRGVLWANV